MPFLYCIDTDGAALSRCPVHHKQIIVGRSRSADVSIPDDHALSLEHFVLVAGASGITIRDLGSTNGTWINGRRVREQSLKPHDRILAGKSDFALEPGLATMVHEMTRTSA